MLVERTVHLKLCDDAEYSEFSSRQVGEYAMQLARAGEVSADESISVARSRLTELTADRLRSSGHEFLTARSAEDDARIGWLWLSPPPDFLGPGHERTHWLSQLTVEEMHRRAGWGRAILKELEPHVRRRGYNAIWLRVFDWNTPARRLYEAQGYCLERKFDLDAHLGKRITS